LATLLTILHVTACVLMIGIILLQHGKGADIGAAFGGGSHTLFGARGATSFLAKVTVTCAGIFMVTSLSLAVAARNQAGSSVVDDMGVTSTEFFTDEIAPAALPDLSAPAEGNAAPTGGN